MSETGETPSGVVSEIPKEVIKEESFKFVANKVADRAVSEGLWRYRDENGLSLSEEEARFTNRARLLAVAKEEREKFHFYERPEIESPPSGDVLETRMVALLDRFIESEVESGCIPKYIVELAGRLSKSSDIRVVSEGWLGYRGGANVEKRYDRGVFPAEGEPRPEIAITETIVIDRARDYLRIAQAESSSLSEEQAIDMALVTIAGHEWSHSIERAAYSQYATTLRGLPEFNQQPDDDFAEYRLTDEVVYKHARESVGPVLENISRQNDRGMHTERFATSFEFLAMESYLQNLGWSEEDISKFTQNYQLPLTERLQDFAKLRDKLGKDDLELVFLYMDLKHFVDREKLDFYVPYLFSGIGYWASYSREQLKEMLIKTEENLRDSENIRQDLENERLRRQKRSEIWPDPLPPELE